VLVEHDGRRPWAHPDAYVAPNAVLSGGVRVGAGSRVLFGAVLTDEGGPVHIGCRLGPGARVPIGWVAVGDPAHLHPPDAVEAIRGGIEAQGRGFLPYVFGVDPALARPEAMGAAMGRYTAALAAHQADRIIEDDAFSAPGEAEG
jgi:hypothetical protein